MRLAAANASEFDMAVTDFAVRLRRFIRRRVHDDATADDLTQETLLKVYRSRSGPPEAGRLEAWIYRIARNTLIDHYRRGRRRPTEELPQSLADEPADDVEDFRRAVIASMRCMLADMPEIYREPVRLAELEGLPLAKIALRMDLSLTAVKSRVRRGRAMLKKRLQQCCRFEFDRMGKVINWKSRGSCSACSC